MDRLQIQTFVVGGTTISRANRFTVAFSDDLEMFRIMHGSKPFEKLLKFRTEFVVSFIRRSPKSISSRFRKSVDFQDGIITGRFLECDATISRGIDMGLLRVPSGTGKFREIIVAAIFLGVFGTNYGDIVAELTEFGCKGVNVQL